MTDSEKIKRAADLINEAERWLMATAGFQPITDALAAIYTARHEVVKLKLAVEAEEDAEAEPKCDCGMIESGRHHMLCPTQEKRSKPPAVPPGILELQRAFRRPEEQPIPDPNHTEQGKPQVILEPRKNPPTDPNQPGYDWTKIP